MARDPVVVSETSRETSARREPKRRMSYEEFLAWADEDTWAEWIDGEVLVFSPASTQHQRIAHFLASVIGIYAEHHNLGVVIAAPFQMKLERGREPDLLFVAREHMDRLHETYLQGPADLVVEIVSPESLARDWREKYAEYEQGGVREYWLVDPDHRWAEFYRLDEEGRYRRAFAGTEGVYRSEVLSGFWLRVEWLWQDPLPEVERTAWEVLGYEQVVRRLVQAAGIEEVRRLLQQWEEQG